MSISLSKLATVRSREAADCLGYLERVTRRFGVPVVLGLLDPHRRFSMWCDAEQGRPHPAYRIPLDVMPFDAAVREGALRLGACVDEPQGPAGPGQLSWPRYPSPSKLGGAEPEHVPLDPFATTLTAGVILGDPGCGKTEWLKGRAAEEANDQHRSLMLGQLAASTVRLPVYADLPTVAAYRAPAKHQEPEIRSRFVAWAASIESVAASALKGERRTELAILAAAADRLGLEPDDPFAVRVLERVRKQWGRRRGVDAGLILLDALDEVDDRHRTGLTTALTEVLASQRGRVFVTSRRLGYAMRSLGAAREFLVLPLSEEGKVALVRGFLTDTDRASRMLDAIENAAPAVVEVLGNPLLATLLAWAFDPESDEPITLPVVRAELYDKVLRKVLLLERKERVEPLRGLADEVLDELGTVACRLPQEAFLSTEIRKLARETQYPELRRYLQRNDLELPALLASCGLLGGYGAHAVRFLHLSVQEYLAARSLANAGIEGWRELFTHLTDDRWHEVVLLAAGCLWQGEGFDGGGEERVRAFLNELLTLGSPEGTEPSVTRAYAVAFARRIVTELQPLRRGPLRGTVYEGAAQEAMAVVSPGAPPTPEWVRVEVGDALGQLPGGDPRLVAESYWVRIEPGRFLMGAQSESEGAPGYDPEAFADEGPPRRIDLRERFEAGEYFEMGRFPVTVGEYRRFVDAGGYTEPKWWQERDGWANSPFGRESEPLDWEFRLMRPNHPVDGLSWYEAKAYCLWLSEQEGYEGARLPTEAEWEYAARGPGETPRRYPWGNGDPTPAHANFGVRIRRPTPVGIYPAGRTPCGVHDMVGNVWEWCEDDYHPMYVGGPPEDGSPWVETPGAAGCVLRGGLFYLAARYLRATARWVFRPGDRVFGSGFRLARSRCLEP